MTDPGFYDMVPGSIGTIQYKKNVIKHLSIEAKQKFIDKASNEKMRQFMYNMTYNGSNGTGTTDPIEAYSKARKDSLTELDESDVGTKIIDINIQIGQKEFYNMIIKIEEQDDFSGWLNPALVNLIKEQYKKI